jgi:peptidoglycan/LPS O-acetylase OafA/YrhL
MNYTRSTPNSTRLHFLDVIRGLAALAVVLEHSGDRIFPAFREFTHDTFSVGKFGVTMFFLTSGFVIPLSLERHKSVASFWKSRVFRLYPLYWFSLLAAVSLYMIGFRQMLAPQFADHLLRNILVNTTMLQELVRVPHAIGLYYTLTIEMVFYLACTALRCARLLSRSYVLCWAALVFTAAAGIAVPLILHRRVPMAGLFYVLTLGIGTVFLRHYQQHISTKSLISILTSTILLAAIAVWLNYVVHEKTDVSERFSFIAVFAPWLTAYLVFFLSYLARRVRFPALLLWLGDISYSVYLLHHLWLFALPEKTNSFTEFLLLIGGVLVTSSATFYLIEKPMIALGRTNTQDRPGKDPPPAFRADTSETLLVR